MGTSMLLKLNELISVHFNNFIEATLLWWTVDTFSKFLNSKQFSLAGADESFQFQNNEDLDKSWDKMKIKYQLNHFIQSAAVYRTPLEDWMLVCVFLDWRTTEGLLTLDFRLWSIKFTSLQVAALRSSRLVIYFMKLLENATENGISPSYSWSIVLLHISCLTVNPLYCIL